MGSIEIISLVKGLWVAFIPILLKAWNILDNRFKVNEAKVENITKEQSELRADVKVLIERSENQQESLAKIEDMVMKLLLRDDDK